MNDVDTIRWALDTFWLLEEDDQKLHAEALAALGRVVAERDELRARLQQQEQADSGDDRWSAVVSSAAQATPAPWQEDGHDIVAPNYRGDMIGRVGMLHFQGDARFVVALVNWFFAHAESAGGTTPPLAAPESASPSNQFGGASGASGTAAWEQELCGAPRASRACEVETPTKPCWCRRGTSTGSARPPQPAVGFYGASPLTKPELIRQLLARVVLLEEALRAIEPLVVDLSERGWIKGAEAVGIVRAALVGVET